MIFTGLKKFTNGRKLSQTLIERSCKRPGTLTVVTLNGQKRPGTLETGRRNAIERIVENVHGTASVHLSSRFLNESRPDRSNAPDRSPFLSV